MKLRILLVDDQALFRAGIKMLIESQPDMLCVGEAEHGVQAVAQAMELKPDLILMDLQMPELDGVLATREIVAIAEAKGEPAPKIIALTTFRQDKAVLAAMRNGASGYLLKTAEPEFLLASLRAVYKGQSVVVSDAGAGLFSRGAAGPDQAAVEQLSPREREVLLLVASGLGNGDIAASLFLTEATVKSHVRSILAKLELKTRVQLVSFAYRKRLIG